MSEEEQYDEAMEHIRETTQVILTPDDFSDGNFLLYSQGMHENHELPDLEIRGVPGMFTGSASALINEINSYRIVNRDNPVLVGQTMRWNTGDILVEESEVYDNTLLLTSRLTDVECCVQCECREAGVTE
ncbi:MAG: hypothetical protein CMB45_05110 [Euryarchaeota archaeon]|nr:hypothetical protein [Euryarchaeota archaeon]|tara:strand:- start:9369 stop:9758 length:390 start_codon:yes stop_codon:yes gene_type:complete